MKLYYLPSYPGRMKVSSICSGNNISSRFDLIAIDVNNLHFLIHRTVRMGFLNFIWEDGPFRNEDKLFCWKSLKIYTLFRFDISSFFVVSSTSSWIVIHKGAILSVHPQIGLDLVQSETLENSQFLNVSFKLNCPLLLGVI